MKKEEAISLLMQAVEVAQARGVYSLKDSAMIFTAMEALKVEEVEEVKEEEKGEKTKKK